MKARICTLLSLIATLVLFPTPATGGPSLSPTASGALVFVEAQFDMGLDYPTSAALSPGGQHVYVTGYEGDAVAVFDRDSATGALLYVEKKVDGASGVNGLDGASSVAVSPDGQHVYVTGYDDNAVAIFGRDTDTGGLTYKSVIQDGDGGVVDGLQAPSSIALDPDGHYVFVASYMDNSIAVFRRDVTTGALTFIQVIKDSDGGVVDGLAVASSVAVSPDGEHVYVTGYTDNAVAILEWQPTLETLTYLGRVKNGEDDVDGLLAPMSVVVSPDGQHVYVAGSDGDAVVVFSRNATTGMLDYVECHKDGVLGVNGLNYAQGVTVSPDGHHVYVAGRDDHAVAIFGRNASSGVLHYEGIVQQGVNGVNGLIAVAAVVVSPDPGGNHVYTVGGASDAVAAFSRNASSGALTFIRMYQNALGLDGAVGVALSPDGAYVYATGNNADSVVVFEREGLPGGLKYVERKSVGAGAKGLDGARSVAVSPDGEYVYVAGHEDDAIAIFNRNAATGRLTQVGAAVNGQDGVVGLDGPQSLTISPDGSLVYAACYVGDSVVIFDRDQTTGALTFKECLQDGTGSVDSLGGAYAVAVTSNGATFYVASIDDDAVSIFCWVGETLYYLGAMEDGVGEVDGLNGANSLALTSDDRYLYVASRSENAVAIFFRSSSIGALTYRGKVQDGVGGVDGLGGARAIAVGPDDRRVYVASQTDHALAVFQRDAATGALTFLEALKDTDAGVNGLGTADSLVVSTDGHVYVTGYNDDAVADIKSQFLVYLPLALR